ncbi:hypothetical protein PENTCL1PPCAC_10268, partial [Pristionchus entomophagus]
ESKDKRQGKSKTLAVMKNRFKAHIKNTHDLNDLRIYEKTGRIPRNKLDGLRLLADELKQRIDEKLDGGLPVHDKDIRKIAIDLNRVSNYSLFHSTSASCITRWKRHNRFVSRKVTKYVTKKMVRDLEETKQKIRDLITNFVQVVKSNPGIVVVNADQMGIQKETHSTRTIARKGSRKVTMKAQSTNAMTHSLTVLPVVYLEGQQHPKMYVHLGEPTGAPPKKGCYQNPNMVVGVSKSHMMGTAAAIKFYKEVLFIPPMPKKMLLLLDSWPLFCNHVLIQSLVPPGHTVIILNFPPGGTCLAQPLDLQYNQQFKVIV